MIESKDLPFNLKRGDFSLQANFTEPQFDLLANSAGISQHLNCQVG